MVVRELFLHTHYTQWQGSKIKILLEGNLNFWNKIIWIKFSFTKIMPPPRYLRQHSWRSINWSSSAFSIHSTDLALIECIVFPHIKSFCAARDLLNNLQELRQEVLNVISRIKQKQCVRIFDEWVKWYKRCVELNGEYVEKSCLYLVFDVG